MVKGCYGYLKTVWLLSTEHLDHWQGSYKTMNFKEIRLFNNAESHFQAQVAQGFIRTF